MEGIKIKKSLFVDDMIINVENPREPRKQILEPTGEFSKVTGYRVNIENQLHPYIPTVNDWKMKLKGFLVAEWLRICLPMQGTRVRALVWEDPTCRGATRPVSHNY